MKSFLTVLSLILALSYTQVLSAQTNMRSFIFGHSLLDHRPPLVPTPSNETTVPHWLYLLATEAGHSYAATGQYGFLPQHANLPPIAQWGYDLFPPVWDSDLETFSEANFNNILITAGNFMQWQAPNLPYPNLGGITPISATEDIINWLGQQENGLRYYIYENWPDMAPYIAGSFPPSGSELANYYAYTDGAFHDWWLSYHDALLASLPSAEVKMIPVGPILSDLLTNTVLQQIPVTELYEDDAPHGRATLYFLASLVTYMATYEEPAPASFSVPSIVHSTVSSNYAMIVDHIWNALLAFNLPNGDSRVFFNPVLPVALTDFSGVIQDNTVELSWTTLSESNNEKFEIEYSTDGSSFEKIGEVLGQIHSQTARDYRFVHSPVSATFNYYRLKQVDLDGSFEYSDTIVLQLAPPASTAGYFFPNPSRDGIFQWQAEVIQPTGFQLSVFDAMGKIVAEDQGELIPGKQLTTFDLSQLGKGVYVFRLRQQQQQQVYHKVIIH